MICHECKKIKIESLLVNVMQSALVGCNDIGLGLLGIYDNYTAYTQGLDCLGEIFKLISESDLADGRAKVMYFEFNKMRTRIKNEYESKQA